MADDGTPSDDPAAVSREVAESIRRAAAEADAATSAHNRTDGGRDGDGGGVRGHGEAGDEAAAGEHGIDLPAEWAIDAALGAAATAGRVASAVGRSGPGRAATGAAKFLTRPLTQEGQEVRERIGHDAGPAAKEVLQQVTPGVVDAVPLNDVLAAIDINALISRVDLNAILANLDLNPILANLDLNPILANLDLNPILVNLDLNPILENLDLNAVLDNVDLDALIGKLDIDQLIENTEMGSIIARSTTGVATGALDAVRSQGVSLDNVMARVAGRLTRRDIESLPAGPAMLVPDEPRALPPGAGAGDDDVVDAEVVTPEGAATGGADR